MDRHHESAVTAIQITGPWNPSLPPHGDEDGDDDDDDDEDDDDDDVDDDDDADDDDAMRT